jgi:CubicO group peptidase (beta-lactamase class C family)
LAARYQAGYHAVTLGWYQSELIRRVDPKGRTIGRFFAEEIAAPLDLDFYIGLPVSVDRNRVAQLQAFALRELVLHMNTMPPMFAAAMFNPSSLSARAFVVAAGCQGRRGLQPRRTPGVRNAVGQRHGYRAVDREGVRRRSHSEVPGWP